MTDTSNKSYPLREDVETIDGIIKAYYEVVSGPAGQPRQWLRDRSLHHPSALIVFTRVDEHGKPYEIVKNLEEFHADTKIYENGFWESETNRKIVRFGNIAHVWSTYKTQIGKHTKSGGINSIQLYYDGNRWWIMSWMFDSERPDNLIPK